MILTELRKNNLVLHDGKIKAVEAIGYDKVAVGGKYVNADEIYPVKLTEELLLKCGFEKEGIAYIKGDFDVTKWSDGRFMYGGKINLYVSSVHQLQNLYQSLTSKELEINL